MIKNIFKSPGYDDINTSYERIVNNNYDYDYKKEHLKVKIYNLDTLDTLMDKATKNKNIMELWIARDGDGQLCLFDDEPVLRGNDNIDYLYFESKDLMKGYIKLPRDYFPDLTFDKSPRKIELKIL